jgi:autotransporter-associated beta strand protein
VPIAINPDGNSLTLGSSGVDMSLATTGLTISCPVVLGSSQSWNVNNGQSLLMAGTVSGSGNLTKLGSGTLTLSAKDSATGMIVVSNGDFILSPSGNFSSSIFIAAGATFDVSENTGFNLGLAQTLSGSGTVAGPLTASFDSGLIPGGTGTAGTLTISGGLIEGEGVTNYFQLSSAGGTNDLIAVTGNIDLGDLNCFQLKKFGGGNIPSGTYPLITYTGTITNGSVSNSVVQATGVVATLTNITTTTPNEIAVIISPLPLPVISAADFSQLASHGSITLSATNGEAEALAVILTSTNVALSVTNWTPVVTNNFDINGNLLNEAIPANPTAPRQFYIIKEY